MAKIRRALKMYGKGKKSLYKLDNADEGLVSLINLKPKPTLYKPLPKKYITRIIHYLKKSGKVKSINILSDKCPVISYYLNDEPKYIDNLPTSNKLYMYDEGKISKCRQDEVELKEITPFNEVSEDILSLWKLNIKQYPWIYSSCTDYIIKCNYEDEEIYFVRTIDGKWTSLDNFKIADREFNALLDTTGEMTASLNKLYDME